MEYMDEEKPADVVISIQEKYEKLNAMHREMINEIIDAYLYKEKTS